MFSNMQKNAPWRGVLFCAYEALSSINQLRNAWRLFCDGFDKVRVSNWSGEYGLVHACSEFQELCGRWGALNGEAHFYDE